MLKSNPDHQKTRRRNVFLRNTRPKQRRAKLDQQSKADSSVCRPQMSTLRRIFASSEEQKNIDDGKSYMDEGVGKSLPDEARERKFYLVLMNDRHRHKSGS